VLADFHGVAASSEGADISWSPLARFIDGRRRNMTQLYFHCSNTRNVFVDRRGAVVNDLVEALDHATRVVQSLTRTGNLEDWRDWVLHASDDLGDELFVIPFTSVLGEPH
jgi:uncharacterized protein DUF6894